MQIYVRTLLGKEITVEIEGSDTLRDLKGKVQDMEMIPPDQQRFMFGGTQLFDDDGLVLDQINAILTRNENEPIRGNSCITLMLIMRLRGGGNQVYHKPARFQRSSSSLSDQSHDSESDDDELPQNRRNQVHRRPVQIQRSSSSSDQLSYSGSDDELSQIGSSESAASNGVYAIGDKQVSETRVKVLPDSLQTSLDKGLHGDDARLCRRRNKFASNISSEKGHRYWIFLSEAGISMNFVILMIATATFMVPEAIRKLPQLSRMLHGDIAKHDEIKSEILEMVSKVGVEDGGSIALCATLLVVTTAFVLLAIRYCRLSLMFQRLKEDKQNMHLECMNQALKVIDDMLVSQGHMSWSQEERFARTEMLGLILRGTHTPQGRRAIIPRDIK